MSATDDLIQTANRKNILIVKVRSFSVSTIVGLAKGKDPKTDDWSGRYCISDVDGNIKFRSNSEAAITDRDVLGVYDAYGKKVGTVKEWMVSVGVPLLEKDVKKCTVRLGNEKVCDLKKYTEFGSLHFQTLEGPVRINHMEGKEFKVYHKEREVAELREVPVNLKDGYVDKYVVECADGANEVLVALLSIAIDMINS